MFYDTIISITPDLSREGREDSKEKE